MFSVDVLLVTMLAASKKGQAIPTCENLSKLFGYYKAMCTCHAKLRYLDWDGQGSLGEGQNRRTAGGPLRDVNI